MTTYTSQACWACENEIKYGEYLTRVYVQFAPSPQILKWELQPVPIFMSHTEGVL